jgi:heat shock protein HslJ
MRLLLLLVLGLAVAVGCGGEDDGGGTPSPPAEFEDVPWIVTSGLSAPSWEDFAPSASFANGKVSGSAGCNQFNASYEVDGEKLELGEIASSLMACPPLADPVEREYLETLRAVEGWRIENGELVLVDGDGNELLRYGEPSLAGTWAVTSFRREDYVESPIENTYLTAVFGDDGIVAGSTGCNSYEAEFTVERSAMRISKPTKDAQRCDAPQGIMRQERVYLAALPLTRSYEVSGSTLTLKTAEGTIVATYTRE